MTEDQSTEQPEWMRLAWQLAGEIRQRRRAAKLSQPQLANRIGYTKQYVSLAERPQRGLPSSSLVQAIDEALGADGVLVALHEQADDARKACRPGAQPRTMTVETAETTTPDAGSGRGPGPAPDRAEVTTSKRREVLGAAAVAPEILNQVLSEAADEAMEFTRWTGISAVGRGTLDHLELAITDLFHSHHQKPPAELFVVARAYRCRVDELIRGRHTLTELRELYAYAGWLSELMAWLAHDLDDPRTAQAYALDSYTHAEQAGHGELCGWAADAMNAIATHTEDPNRAVRAARKGIAHVPINHPLAIQLRAKAARAYAQLGDRDNFDALFLEARRLHDQMSTQTPSRFTLDTGTMVSFAITAYPAQAYLWLDDFSAAKNHSEAALTAYESAHPVAARPVKVRWPAWCWPPR